MFAECIASDACAALLFGILNSRIYSIQTLNRQVFLRFIRHAAYVFSVSDLHRSKRIYDFVLYLSWDGMLQMVILRQLFLRPLWTCRSSVLISQTARYCYNCTDMFLSVLFLYDFKPKRNMSNFSQIHQYKISRYFLLSE